MNNLQLDLEKEKVLSLEELDKRNDVIDEMSKSAVAFLPLIEIMTTDSKEKMDAIFDYEETFVKDFKEIAESVEDEAKSLAIMQKIEADYEPLVENLKIIEDRLTTANQNMEHLEALYQKLT